MVRQRKVFMDWLLLAAAAAIGVACMCASLAQAQPAAAEAKSAASVSIGPILTAQLPPLTAPARESAAQSKAMRLYRRAIQELHHGNPARAEKDARRAAQFAPGFADGDALAATAALAQRQFLRAHDEAEQATRIDPADATGWVVLATSDNYLFRYAEAAAALKSMPPQSREVWQVAYQRARAEAGQEHAAAALQWVNRAALGAPQNFAPLHLLRASALLADNRYGQAADELQVYLQLAGNTAPQCNALTAELYRIRKLQNVVATPHPQPQPTVAFNALAN